MSIKFKCPKCSQSVQVTLAMAGKKGKCPGCGQSLKIPSEEQLKMLQARAAQASAAATPAAASPPQDDPFAGLGEVSTSSPFDEEDFDFDEPDQTEDAAEANPYASPLAEYKEQISGGSDSEAEATRKRLLKHEAGIKSAGSLFILGALVMGLFSFVYIAAGISGLASGAGGDAVPAGFMIGLGLFLLLMSGLQMWVGFGLRACNPQVRIPAIILAALGLLNIPIGTLINGYFLYLFCSSKGSEVLSRNYQQVIAKTPHIKYRTPVVVWVLLVLLIALAVFGVLALSQG